jgi:polyhydroxybutyrate depolymerase
MNRHLILFFNIIIVSYCSLLFSQAKTIYVQDENIIFPRSYHLHLPANYSDTTDYPLVLGFHGHGGTGTSWQGYSHWINKSDSAGFISAYPDGIGNVWNVGGPWESWTGYRDDVEFTSVLIDTLCSQYSIDSTKVYATGLSNGARMVYRLAAELSDKISAIGPVAGKMAFFDFNPEFPVGIVHFHSLYDNTVPYEAGYQYNYYFPSVDSILTIWADKNNCNSNPDTVDVAFGIKKISWHAPESHGDIDLYAIANSAHAWPSGYISATDIIWDFFKSHSRDYLTNIQADNKSSRKATFGLLQNYPNPFNPSTKIKYNLKKSSHIKLKIYNLTGDELETLICGFQTAGDYEVTWLPKGFPSGIYFYRLQASDLSETRKLIYQK